jgi:hypothetical protein
MFIILLVPVFFYLLLVSGGENQYDVGFVAEDSKPLALSSVLEGSYDLTAIPKTTVKAFHFGYDTCAPNVATVSQNFDYVRSHFDEDSTIQFFTVLPDTVCEEHLVRFLDLAKENTVVLPASEHLSAALKTSWHGDQFYEEKFEDYPPSQKFYLLDKQNRLRGIYIGGDKKDMARMINEIGVLKKEYERDER